MPPVPPRALAGAARRGLPGRPVLSRLGLLLPALVVGCAGTPEGETPPETRLTAVDALPEGHRELWVAWRDDSSRYPELERQALEEYAAGRPGLIDFLVDNLILEMVRGYQAGEFASTRRTVLGRYERARNQLVDLGEPATERVAQLLGVGNGYGPTLARGVLVEIGRPSIPAVMRQLDSADPKTRGLAAQLLGELPHAHGEEAVVRAALAAHLEDDPEWVVRKASAEALGLRGSRDLVVEPTRKSLCRALSDPDPEVARAAAAALALIQDPGAIPALINYLERAEREADLVAHRRASATLKRLSGVDQDLDVRGWRRWWADHRPAPRGASPTSGG